MEIKTKGKEMYSRGMAWQYTVVGKYRWVKNNNN